MWNAFKPFYNKHTIHVEREGEGGGTSKCHPLIRGSWGYCCCSGLLISDVQNNAHQLVQCVSASRCCHPSLWNKQRKCIRRPQPQMESTSPCSAYAAKAPRWKPISMSIVFQGPLPPGSGKLKKEHPTCVCRHKGPLWLGRCYQPSCATAAAFQWRLPRIAHCSKGGWTPLGGISWHPAQMEVGGAGRPARLMTKISGHRGATLGDPANKVLGNYRCGDWFTKCSHFLLVVVNKYCLEKSSHLITWDSAPSFGGKKNWDTLVLLFCSYSQAFLICKNFPITGNLDPDSVTATLNGGNQEWLIFIKPLIWNPDLQWDKHDPWNAPVKFSL